MENAFFRIDASFPIDLDFAFNELLKSGIDIKYCNMCDFYKFNEYVERSMCVLYKSKGTPKYPKLSCANSCACFKIRKFNLHSENQAGFGYKIYINK